MVEMTSVLKLSNDSLVPFPWTVTTAKFLGSSLCTHYLQFLFTYLFMPLKSSSDIFKEEPPSHHPPQGPFYFLVPQSIDQWI